MKISYNWLKDYAKVNLEIEQASDILTDLGLEVEGIEHFETIKGGLKGIVVAEVLSVEQHPNADKLKVTKVDIGNGESLQVVCGAANVAKGQKVPLATIGTVLYDEKGEGFTIKESKLRGELSQGMICAEDELGLGEGHQGIMVLDVNLKSGTPAADVFNVQSDHVIEIGLTPNRADAMSHYGTARDLITRLNYTGSNIKLELPDYKIKEGTDKPLTIKVECPELAPRYAGLVVKGLKVAPSPPWLQNRLKSIGLKPINNLVDISNYVLHSLGQPLHIFDLSETGNQIIVKTCPEGTPFVTLDGVERKLASEDLMICSAKEPMCIAGVFGGQNSGVKDSTTEVFIESAYFDPISIRKSSKRHGLKTDASFRFERGIDPNITIIALKYAAKLICEIAGGEIASSIYDICDNKITEPFKVELKYKNIERLLGKDLGRENVKKILNCLEIKIEKETKDSLSLSVPPYRVDVQREADVIEELLRVYGYNNVQMSEYLHTSIVKGNKFSAERLYNIAADTLASRGFCEILSNSLTQSAYLEILSDIEQQETVHILNPLSRELDVLRQSLLFGALEAVSRNISFKNTDLKLFELGKVYSKLENGYKEKQHLVVLITGKDEQENWIKQQGQSTFFTLKKEIETLLVRFGFKNLKQKPSDNAAFENGLGLYQGKKLLCELGEVKKNILKKFDISQAVYYADLNWELIVSMAVEQQIIVEELRKFPLVRRDLALLLDNKVSYSELYNAAFAAERNILKEVALFDVYQGGKLPEGKKSYALSFVLNDENATLTDKKIEQTMQKILDAFIKQFSAELRT